MIYLEKWYGKHHTLETCQGSRQKGAIMVTIKDIAKHAGVAQGTVSNVLNGKGNVSSEKIKRVMEAARELGYVANERAALLRKGLSDSLAVIMPNLRAKQYQDFYSGFKRYALAHGFAVTQFLTHENSTASELEALNEVKSLLVKGVAYISGFTGTPLENAAYLENTDLPNLLYVERRPVLSAGFIGFDYEQAGFDMGQKALAEKFTNVCLLTGNLQFSNESDFYQGFMKAISASDCLVTHIQTDSFRKYQNIMQIFNGLMPQAFFISNYGFAESVKDICTTFYDTEDKLCIYTVSPVFTMPENDFIKYEMDYRQLGKTAAETLIKGAVRPDKRQEGQNYLKMNGFRDWYANIIVPKDKRPLNVLTLDTPEAYTMRNLSRLYTKKTGVDVNICIASYDEIYEAFNTMNSSSNYDILRLDVTWLSWFAGRILQPLSDIDPEILDCFGNFLDGTLEHYGRVHGKVYALPSTPSVQLLYYRKDVFESPIYKRMYLEQYKKELAPPETFDEFNQIARFFTKSQNPSSPVEYGATVTLGSTGVTGSEFLARYFSHQDHLYDSNREIRLDSEVGIQSLHELVRLKGYTSPNYCNWWTNTAKSFASGNFAMSMMYSNFATDLLSNFSNIVGKIGYAMIPGGNPAIGGGSLGVCRYSERPEDALSFIKWMCSEPISSAASLLGSTSPCRQTYDNYEIINNFPWLNLVKKSFVLAKGNRMPEDINLPFDERKFLNILGMAVKNAYNNICTPEAALVNAQKQFEQHFPRWR